MSSPQDQAPLEETILIDSTQERIRASLGELEVEFLPSKDGVTTLSVAREQTRAVVAALRDSARFDTITMVTAVDHLPANPRFEIIHQLLCREKAERVRIKTQLEENDARIDSIVGLFPGANYMERECFDMFGIDFIDHPDLRRLLMPEGYGHNPLLKDFPHQGIEPDRLYREWEAKRREQWQPASSERAGS